MNTAVHRLKPTQSKEFKYKKYLPIILLFACVIHLLFLASLFSEPFHWDPEINMTGTKSHPQEQHQLRGFLDPFFHDTDRVPRGLDFFSIYQAGYNFLNGCSVYYGVREHKFGDKFMVVPYFSGFRYLPSYACIFGSILNTFQPCTSYWVWVVCVECLLLLNIYALWLIPTSNYVRIVSSIMWLTYTPYYIELHIGQQSMVTATLLHFTGLYHFKNKPILRDASYILSVLWKLNTLLLIPIWIKLKRFRSIVLTIFLISLFSVPYFLSVPGSFSEFFSYFHLKFIPTGPSSLGLWSLIGTIWQRFWPESDHLRMILNLISLSLVLCASIATFLPRKIDFIHALSLWVCMYFLTYQYVWEHHYIMLLPIFSLLLISDKSNVWLFVWLFCALPTPYILFNIPALDMPQLHWNTLQDILYHSTKIIPVFIMFVILSYKMISNSAFSILRTKPQSSNVDNSFQ